jgi:hypothetical protein
MNMSERKIKIMKMNQIKIALIAIAATTGIALTSCNRDKGIKDKDSDTSYSQDNAMGEFVYNDAGNIADESSNANSGDNLENYKTTSNCAIVTKDTVSNPKTITVDFGSVNCMCNDGRNRRGKILIDYTGHYRDSGSVHHITFDNYFVNDNKVMGNKTVENMGHNASNQLYFNITVNGLMIKAITADSVTWNSNRVRTWLVGEPTQTRLDDVYQISGNGSGQRANGIQYTMTITQPLIKEIACQWIKAGEVQIQPTGGLLRTINYGNGTCDNQATVTVNGNTYNITLN